MMQSKSCLLQVDTEKPKKTNCAGLEHLLALKKLMTAAYTHTAKRFLKFNNMWCVSLMSSLVAALFLSYFSFVLIVTKWRFQWFHCFISLFCNSVQHLSNILVHSFVPLPQGMIWRVWQLKLPHNKMIVQWRKRYGVRVTPAINPATFREWSGTTGLCLYFKSLQS